MVRDLRKIHLRIWLVLGPLVLAAVGVVLTARAGPAIPDAPVQDTETTLDAPPLDLTVPGADS